MMPSRNIGKITKQKPTLKITKLAKKEKAVALDSSGESERGGNVVRLIDSHNDKLKNVDTGRTLPKEKVSETKGNRGKAMIVDLEGKE